MGVESPSILLRRLTQGSGNLVQTQGIICDQATVRQHNPGGAACKLRTSRCEGLGAMETATGVRSGPTRTTPDWPRWYLTSPTLQDSSRKRTAQTSGSS
jgi:hypothetical protein